MGLFDNLKDIAIPAAIGYFGGPAASSLLGGNAILGGAAASGLGSLVMGGKPKDALRAALLGGLGGAGSEYMQNRALTNAATKAAAPSIGSGIGQVDNTLAQAAARKSAADAATTQIASGASSPVTTAGKTMSGDLLKSLNLAGDTEEGNILFRALNTQLGEGVTAGLIAKLLAGDDEDEDNRGSFEIRPYAQGGPGGKLGGINYNQGGIVQYLNQGGMPQNYPRRDGPIAPYEGSGTKDDVPAMLTAGEFVMTRDAVKGAGGGDLNQGLNRMYGMMDKFEGMA
tara:strand:+ start:2281 stop:3132 length:852 start_codon:yes stop_codon:yes gene_type:complete